MSTALSTLDHNLLPLAQIGTDEELQSLARSADFLGRLQLYTKGKAIDKGKIRPGHYGIPGSGEEITDLGDTIDIIPFGRKTKAIDMSDKEAIIVSYDMSSAEFKRIQAQAQEKESNCMYGPSFLVFERASGRFLEFFCGSKSTRGEAGKIYPFLQLTQTEIDRRAEMGIDVSKMEPHGPLPLTLTSRLVEKGSYSWHVPVAHECSLDFDNLPALEIIVNEINRFVTLKGDGTEKVQEGDKKRRAR